MTETEPPRTWFELTDEEKFLRLAERTAIGLPPLTAAEKVAFVEGHIHGGQASEN